VVTKDEIINSLSKKMNLSIYNIEESENYVYLKLKKEILEENIISFIKEQFKKIDSSWAKKYYDEICKLEVKKYDELMEIAKEKSITPFQYSEGSIYSNDVSYLIDGNNYCCADVISYFSEGKVIMECYSCLFEYFRETIIESTDNPIKDAFVITITG